MIKPNSFAEAIIAFNKMYNLHVNEEPSLDIGMDVSIRLQNFKRILLEEIDEIDSIIEECKDRKVSDIDVLTELADLLVDIQIYCASEMVKFGLPLPAILHIAMDSNFSKLGKDGLPIYDERGKVLKGPNYWRPEPKIAALIKQLINKE